eukprot:TRINITY_DN77753_c0_g1_i1.p1 TRINITY_DN77753_c0_g1~~TRINITY_DN77753_c0_g1_i1.p1  ORF type:complete len:354 (-),score=77.40 TRINITY_DN77753_c0_g1_i1:37-1098(-)
MSRRRERSRTPEVAWEILPTFKDASQAPAKRRATNAEAAQKAAEDKAAAEKAAAEKLAAAKERGAWRYLLILLAGLHGDPKVEEFLNEKHPELIGLAKECGGEKPISLTAAKDKAKGWFARGLKGSNQHGPAARLMLCKKTVASLQEHSASLCSAASPDRLAGVLRSGRPEEEGPLVCSVLSQQLRGSSYEGLWVEHRGPAGHFFLGDGHEGANLPTTNRHGDAIPGGPRVHVVVKMKDGELVIEKFLLDDDDDPIWFPAMVPVGPFLSVYFEGMTVAEATAAWKNGPPPPRGGAQRASAASGAAPSHQDPKLRAIQATLPPGWEIRESRSKKGVYFYANPAKGLTQMERPKI